MTDTPVPILAEEGEIPLPPEEMFEALDNSGPATTQSPAPARIGEPSKAAVKLAFTGGKVWSKDVPLDFPFEWEGREVSTITVRRLTTDEMGEVVSQHGSDFDQWDVFAAMIGLPSSVLRGLEAGDGDAVSGVAYDFLPRSLKKDG